MHSGRIRFIRSKVTPLVTAGIFLFLLQVHGFCIITNSAAFAFSGEDQTRRAEPPVPGAGTADGADTAGSVHKALEAYDRAFQARDLDALKQIFADDVVMYEQGTQNIGREDVLTNHLGPELRTFQEMTAGFSDLRVRESPGMAIINRQFSIRGKRQGRFFSIRGSETQGWVFREGRWLLAHLHLSFPSSR